MKGNLTGKGRRLETLKEMLLREEKSIYDLVDETGYSRRTVFRDLSELKARGYALFKTGNDSYRISPIEEEASVRELRLTGSEFRALRMLLDYVDLPETLKAKIRDLE